MDRPKLELEPNTSTMLTMIFDKPIEGENRYGKYYLFAVKTADEKEFSFFAPNEEVAEELKKYRRVSITKLAAKRGNKVVTSYSVTPMNGVGSNSDTEAEEPVRESYYTAMEKSFKEAIDLQQKFNGMANVNQIAITLFIQRTKGNHSFAT